MLLNVLLLTLSLCNAQVALPSLWYEDAGPLPADASSWVENIPYVRVPHAANIPQGVKLSPNSNLRLSAANNQKLKAVFNDGKAIETQESVDSMSRYLQPDETNDGGKAEGINRNGKSIPSVLSQLANDKSLFSNSAVKDRVTKLVNAGISLRNDTDQLIDQLRFLYENVATDEADNQRGYNSYFKYSVSVVVRFMFEFYRLFRKLTSQSADTQLQLTNVDTYHKAFDTAIDVMKDKRDYSPLALSVPIKRSLDIFKSILYESVVLIQSKCSVADLNWQCVIVYLANLVEESYNCSNVWFHALIHMLALENIETSNSFVYKIVNLGKLQEFSSFVDLFDEVIEGIQEYREVGSSELTAKALFYTLLVDLQNNGLLDCLSVDYVYN